MQENELNRLKILDFADQYLQPYKIRTKNNGDGDEIIPDYCPFCHGGASKDKGTFALSISKGVFVCKRGSCGKYGRFEKLAEFVGDSTTLDRTGKPSASKKEKTYDLPDTELLPLTDQIVSYFNKRKISRETLEAFHVSADAKGMIVFPFYLDGVNVFEKFRRPWKPKPEEKGKEWAFPGAKPILFGMDLCSFSRPLIITEGMIDTLSLYEAGIRNVVSVPSGCENFEWVENCWDFLEKFRQIIFFGDNDDPGRKMVQTLCHRLDESRCSIVENYPESPRGGLCKDANEVLFFYGEMQLIQMVEEATEAPIHGLINLGDVVPKANDDTERILTMIPDLDKAILGLRMGAVTVWTGKAGYGKSTLSGLLELQALEQGYNVCVYSGELTKEEYQDWVNRQCAGGEYIGFKKKADGDIISTLSYAVQKEISSYYNHRLWLYDNQEIFEENEAAMILKLFTAAYRRYDCRLFVVDNLMMALADSDDELRDQKRFVNKLKKFARKYNVHVMIVAHPRKTKKDEKLDNQDVGGNSAIGNIADATMVMERPNIRVVKNRITGKTPVVECCYCPDSRRIFQLDAGDRNHFSWNKHGIPPLEPSQRACSQHEFDIQLPEDAPF